MTTFTPQEFYLADLNCELTLGAAILFEDIVHSIEDGDATLPTVTLNLTEAQRLELGKMSTVCLKEDLHIDQAATTLADEVYEQAILSYNYSSSKFPSMELSGLHSNSLDHPVALQGSGSDNDPKKFHQRLTTDNAPKSFISDLVYQAVGFRLIENELKNITLLEAEVENFLKGTAAGSVEALAKAAIEGSQTAATAPTGGDYSIPRTQMMDTIKKICVENVLTAAADKRLTNDATVGMFRAANQVVGVPNCYYLEALAGDVFTFEVTLSPSALPVVPVYAGGPAPNQISKKFQVRMQC
jgi:hypothetical protein